LLQDFLSSVKEEPRQKGKAKSVAALRSRKIKETTKSEVKKTWRSDSADYLIEKKVRVINSAYLV